MNELDPKIIETTFKKQLKVIDEVILIEQQLKEIISDMIVLVATKELNALYSDDYAACLHKIYRLHSAFCHLFYDGSIGWMRNKFKVINSAKHIIRSLTYIEYDDNTIIDKVHFFTILNRSLDYNQNQLYVAKLEILTDPHSPILELFHEQKLIFEQNL